MQKKHSSSYPPRRTGADGFTVVSFKQDTTPNFCWFLQEMVYCRSPFAANTVYALLGPQSPHQCPWCRPTQGLHGQMDSDVSHVQGHHLTGLRGRTLGVSASAGNKAEIYRCVWGSLGGGWGWHSGLDRHMLWCVPMRLQTCGIICSPLPTEILQTCAISKAYWCWCILCSHKPLLDE